MPEQLDPRPAETAPPGTQDGASPPGAKREEGAPKGNRDPFWDRDDVLWLSPEQREVNADFNWATEQEARGAFDAYLGKLLAIVNKTVLAVGEDAVTIRAEAARKAGVEPYRVAIYLVEDLGW
jgi:hypothetical protein